MAKGTTKNTTERERQKWVKAHRFRAGKCKPCLFCEKSYMPEFTGERYSRRATRYPKTLFCSAECDLAYVRRVLADNATPRAVKRGITKADKAVGDGRKVSSAE